MDPLPIEQCTKYSSDTLINAHLTLLARKFPLTILRKEQYTKDQQQSGIFKGHAEGFFKEITLQLVTGR